jgi:hypothetical protein
MAMQMAASSRQAQPTAFERWRIAVAIGLAGDLKGDAGSFMQGNNGAADGGFLRRCAR